MSQDTPEWMFHKQHEIFMALPIRERFAVLDGMIIFARNLAIDRIRQQYPSISEKELKLELIKHYYGNEFSELQMEDIQRHFRTLTQ